MQFLLLRKPAKAIYYYSATLFILALMLNYQLHDYGLCIYDEGLMVALAKAINQGNVIYRDFFMEYPPGHFALPAFIFKHFGENILYIRLLLVLVRSATVLFLFLLTRRFVTGYAALLPPFIYLLVPGPWHKSFLPFFTILDLYFLVDYLQRPQKFKLIWLGFMTALTFLFRQDIGGFFVITVLLSCIFIAPKIDSRAAYKAYFTSIGIYVLSAALFFSPVVAYFYTNGALKDFIRDCFLLSMAVRGETAPAPFPHFNIISFKLGISGFLFYMPFILSLTAAFYILLNKTEAYRTDLVPIVILGILSFMNIWSARDNTHLIQSATPAYVIGAVLGDRLYKRLFSSKGNHTTRLFLLKGAVILVLLFLPSYFLMSYLFSPAGTNPYTPSPMLLFSKVRRLNNAKAPVLLPDGEAKTIESVVGFIDSKFGKDEAVMVIPPQYMIDFLADRKYYYLSDFYYSSQFMTLDQKTALIDKMAQDLPEYIIVDKSRLFLPDSPMALVYHKQFMRYYPEMYEFITRNYSIDDMIGPYVILKRGMNPASVKFYNGLLELRRQNRWRALYYFKEAESGGLPKGLIDYDRLKY